MYIKKVIEIFLILYLNLKNNKILYYIYFLIILAILIKDIYLQIIKKGRFDKICYLI